MGRRTRSVVVAGGVLLVGLVPGVASAKTVANQQYANTYCDTVEAALDGLDTLEQDGYAAPTSEALRTTYLTQTGAIIDSLEQGAADLAKLTPKDGGKKVAKLFDANLTQQAATIQAALDVLAAADPNVRGFTAAADGVLLAGLEAINSWDAPFAQLGKFPALRKALTKACNISRSGG
jgi:hypothetical protein